MCENARWCLVMGRLLEPHMSHKKSTGIHVLMRCLCMYSLSSNVFIKRVLLQSLSCHYCESVILGLYKHQIGYGPSLGLPVGHTIFSQSVQCVSLR